MTPRGSPGIDLLLVGRNLESCLSAAARDGLRAETVPSCLEAFVWVARAAPKVVVLSGSELSGQEIQAIRALKEEPGSPSVLLTVPPHRHLSSETTEGYGADDTLAEPCLPGDVLSRVRALLARRAAAAGGDLLDSGGGREELRRLLADLEELNRHVSNLDQLKDSLLSSFASRSGARRASLLCYTPARPEEAEGGTLVVERSIGLPKEVKQGAQVSLEGTLAGRVALSCRPLLVEDFREEPHRELRNESSYQTYSCLSLPLAIGDRLLAVVNLSDKKDGGPFGERDLRLQAEFARHAAQILETSRSLERVTRLSILDDLTGLYNRRFLRRSLDREFQRAVRYDRPLTVAILDLDYFKVLNDKNGHEVGNRVLVQVADILRSSFRNTDIVARYGGEEFAVILPEVEKGAPPEADSDRGAPGAFHVLERLRLRIQNSTFEGEKLLPNGSLTISGGAACFPLDARTTEELLDSADTALYAAKRQGKNRIALA